MIEKNEKKSSAYKEIVGLLREMNSYYNTMKEMTENYISERYGLSGEILEAFIPITMEYIETKMNDEEINEIFMKYSKDQTITVSNAIEENMISAKSNGVLMDESSSSIAAREVMTDIKKHSLELMNFKAEIDDIKEECEDGINEYLLKLSSPDFMEKRLERIETLKKAAGTEEDENEKRKIMSMVTVMEKVYSLSFVFDRLDEVGEKELNKIMEGFFDRRSGSYIISRYKSKIEKFGFSNKLYTYFFNLEENLLPEEYHVFNNLFLFFYMRFVAYRDPYSENDKLFVQAFTSNISNMVYHKNISAENAFVCIVKKVLDKFEPYRERFILDNTTRPGHPVRIKTSERTEHERKESIIKKMKELNIEADETLSADELMELMNDKLDEIIQSQRTKIDEPGKETNNTDNADGSITNEHAINKVQLSSYYGSTNTGLEKKVENTVDEQEEIFKKLSQEQHNTPVTNL